MLYSTQLKSSFGTAGHGLDSKTTPLRDCRQARKEFVGPMYWAHQYEKQLSVHFLERLEEIDGVVLYGKTGEHLDERLPVFSFEEIDCFFEILKKINA